MFDSVRGEFIQNQLTHQLRELRYNGYKVDRQRHEITAFYFPNVLNPAGCGEISDRYRVVNNVLLLVHQDQIRKATASQCEVIVRDRLNGTMRVTGVHRFVDGKRIQ